MLTQRHAVGLNSSCHSSGTAQSSWLPGLSERVSLTELNLGGFASPNSGGAIYQLPLLGDDVTPSSSACGLSSLPVRRDRGQAVACYSCKDEFIQELCSMPQRCMASHPEGGQELRPTEGCWLQKTQICPSLKAELLVPSMSSTWLVCSPEMFCVLQELNLVSFFPRAIS